MAGDKVGVVIANQVAGMNRFGSKAKMRYRHRTGLLRVIYKIALGMPVGALTNDLDAVLVCTDCAIAAKPVKHGLESPLLGVGTEINIPVQTGLTHIIMNADGKVIFGLFIRQFIKHRFNHRRSEFLGGESITSPNDNRHGFEVTVATEMILGNRSQHILI